MFRVSAIKKKSLVGVEGHFPKERLLVGVLSPSQLDNHPPDKSSRKVIICELQKLLNFFLVGDSVSCMTRQFWKKGRC